MKFKLITTTTALALAGAVALPLSGFAHDNDPSSDQFGRFSNMGNPGRMMSMSSMMGNGMMDSNMMGQMHAMMSDTEDMTDMMSNMVAFMSSHVEQMSEWMNSDDADENLKRPSEPAQK
ncbi:hypothetical protein FDK21_19985 [Cohaesibacter sp. CAU 1516]|uniref:hypothetical protein n=1 Tax=Cohaesibacter sp. CAU 1516 TaxID=2576038 RepID=UPI0010FE73B4|nr:hypothetical protein [Cohaesibacter sp. CAU 1516]TLP42297.1 hypothetical protein FDK21_19985 [Cohaesibacter sp. CAU 1516]